MEEKSLAPPAYSQPQPGTPTQQPYAVQTQPYPQGAPVQQPYPASPQMQAMPPQQAVQQTIVVQSAPRVFGKNPSNLVCNNCHQNVVTTTDSSLKGEAWLYVSFLCFIGGIFCFWIPFVMDSMYVTTHHCPSCRAFQGQSL